MKRLWPYLLLNIAISALTMLAVLLIWNATHHESYLIDPTEAQSEAPTTTSAPTQTLPALDKELFTVDAVIGAGDLANEYIQITYLGDTALNLQGWQVLKGNQVVLTLPAYTVYKGGGFNIYSKVGTNSAIDLYIGKSMAIWKSGDTLKIKDTDGNLRLNYLIP
jgi:hypothetical protein